MNDMNCDIFFIYIMIHITNYIFNISEHIVKNVNLVEDLKLLGISKNVPINKMLH